MIKLKPKQRKELQDDINSGSKGKENAGKHLLLGGGLKWTQLSMTPKDSDWLNGSKYNKQEICEAYRVPTQLLGIEGSQKYANYKEARLAVWIETIIPLMELYCSEMNRWLTPDFGDDIEIDYDENDIDALEPMRNERKKQKQESGAYTINEIRQMYGDEPSPEPEADQIMIDSNKIPLGLDVFTADEKDAQAMAKMLMRNGTPKQEAEQKAYEWLSGCDHGHGS